MTNEEALKKLFPNLDVTVTGKRAIALLDHVGVNDFRLDTTKKWLNMKYKSEGERNDTRQRI